MTIIYHPCVLSLWKLRVQSYYESHKLQLYKKIEQIMIAFTRLAKINRIVGQQCKNFAVGRRRGTNLPARANPKAPATIKSSWTAVTDEATGQIYWWNKATNETVLSSLHPTQKHRFDVTSITKLL